MTTDAAAKADGGTYRSYASPRPTTAERFWSRVSVPYSASSCWEWVAGKTGTGYGVMLVDGRQERAHRVAWFLTYGEWPSDHIDHLCRWRACVNPLHLEVVGLVENVMRGMSPAAQNARRAAA